MFKTINHISDVQPFVADKKEIKFSTQSNGITIGCYQFMDSHTFDTPEALECRGIAFDQNGLVVSRPLHKFFNIGEKPELFEDHLRQRDDVKFVFEKIDGSMIATAWINETLFFRSKKSFTSDVVRLTEEMLVQPDFEHILNFAKHVASRNHTAIFELTHPQARIVVDPRVPALNLLHVRHNNTGEYVMLDPSHAVHEWIKKFDVPVVKKFDLDVDGLLASLVDMTNQEGHVAQFSNGDMVKFKCPWYLRLHRSVTFLRERDIAMASLHENLDDVKNALGEIGIDLTQVNEVESRLKNRLLDLYDQVEQIYENSKHLDRKHFALANKDHELFGLAMTRYLGKEVELADWYGRNKLKAEFGLRVLADATRADAFDMSAPSDPARAPKP